MLKLERTSVMNLENAMRGARNPMNSWGRMDSFYDENGEYKLGPNDLMETVIAKLEEIRLRYLETKNKDDWYDMIQLLPSSYNQMRTCSFNYETLINIYYARKDHKLAEWHTFCDWIKTLPYGEELIIGEGK